MGKCLQTRCSIIQSATYYGNWSNPTMGILLFALRGKKHRLTTSFPVFSELCSYILFPQRYKHCAPSCWKSQVSCNALSLYLDMARIHECLYTPGKRPIDLNHSQIGSCLPLPESNPLNSSQLRETLVQASDPEYLLRKWICFRGQFSPSVSGIHLRLQ